MQLITQIIDDSAAVCRPGMMKMDQLTSDSCICRLIESQSRPTDRQLFIICSITSARRHWYIM